MLLKLEQAGVILAVFLLSCVSALYEDQIKKFDWRLQQIGALHRAHLELNGMQPRLLVSTRENVLASLCPKTGQILWRQVLENSPRGDLKLMQISRASDDMSNTAAARPNSRHGFDMLTVQGSAPALVRGWNANTGLLEWEWSLMPLRTDRAEAAFWVYSNAILYHVLPVWGNHLEITQYFPTTGQTTGSTSKVLAPWISADKCVLSGVFYVCLDGQRLLSLDLTDDKAMVLTKQLNSEPSQPLKVLEGSSGIVIVDNNFVTIKDDIKVCDSMKTENLLVTQYDQRTVALQTTIVDNILHIRAVDLSSCESVSELTQNVPYPAHFGAPTLHTFDCRSLKRSSDGKSCLFVLGTSADNIVGVQQNKIRWSREEALANVVATEFIDLPLADTEGTLENEMKGGNGDLASAFVRRISAQIVQIKSLLLHVLGLAPPQTDSQKAGLVRDSFGLHKMLVILTESGKVFGVDNISGKIHWQYYLPQISNFAHGEQMRLIVQRTSKHFPLQPLCTIVARSKQSGNGVLYRFNPITGKAAEGGLLELNYKIKQLCLLAESDTDYVKGILVLTAEHQVHVYPENAKKNAHGMYLYTADKSTATLNGYYVSYQQQQLTVLPIWNVRLGGHSGDHQIMAVASKNPIERVHSQGRALSDRSVLYKYINPNLIAVVTQTNDSIHKYILNVYLVDVVSGSVVFSMMHRKVRAPLHIVHSENWLAYSYYNDKVRRTEITTIELYEGKTQANSTVWSSLNAPPMPLVERQTYIIPTVVETMRETITERGITNKHVLIGTSSGAIIEMPWVLLDPRRPISSTTQGREEGAIPYIPELPLPTENIINYNQSIARLHNIYTAPSGLESTCLVVATGLDIFVTRVAPSKTFDLLKEDFDYMLISVVLIALTTGSLVVKHLSSKKILKQAWK